DAGRGLVGRPVARLVLLDLAGRRVTRAVHVTTVLALAGSGVTRRIDLVLLLELAWRSLGSPGGVGIRRPVIRRIRGLGGILLRLGVGIGVSRVVHLAGRRIVRLAG